MAKKEKQSETAKLKEKLLIQKKNAVIKLSDEEIADDASAELKRIRREQTNTASKIHTDLNKMVNSTYRTYLQDAVITMRNNRYCLPVKAEYKGSVKGLVHDQSKAGSTFFIEPAAIVELNNRIQELLVEEREEINRILHKLSQEAAEHVEELKANQEILTELDFIFAKANLAIEEEAVKPDYESGEYIDVKRARHPFIDKKKA